jgi:ABC-2 type transport system ATP-binding protein
LLRSALAAASISVSDGADGALLTDAGPEDVGRAALRGSVALAELRSATDASSLEHVFFQLTNGASLPSHNLSESNVEFEEAVR